MSVVSKPRDRALERPLRLVEVPPLASDSREEQLRHRIGPRHALRAERACASCLGGREQLLAIAPVRRERERRAAPEVESRAGAGTARA